MCSLSWDSIDGEQEKLCVGLQEKVEVVVGYKNHRLHPVDHWAKCHAFNIVDVQAKIALIQRHDECLGHRGIRLILNDGLPQHIGRPYQINRIQIDRIADTACK